MMKNSNIHAKTADSNSTHKFSWNWKLTDLEGIKKHRHNVFSCFACGGGSSMGYKLAGFNVVGCNEIDPKMMELYISNNHPKYHYLMDIREFIEQKELPEELYHLDILDGSPPCSVFSVAGKRDEGWNKEKKFREGQKMQRLDDLFFQFIEVAKRLQPKVIVAENVKGIITGKAKGYVHEIVKDLDEAGYDVQIFLLNSARMGVPQARERVFFLGRRKDLDLPEIKLDFREPVIPFKDVRSKKGVALEKNSIIAKMMEHRKATDKDLSDISKRLRRKYAGYTNTINSDKKPSNTITAGGTHLRMCDGMKMSKQDFVNCQTFPQDYDFGKESPQYVCGMSVPPVMIANIADEIYKQWLNR